MAQNPLARIWRWWFTPRSTDPTVNYRERALRVLLPVFFLLRTFGTTWRYLGTSNLPEPYVPSWLALAFFLVPILFSFYFLQKQKVGWSGAFFILHWYLTDLLSLPAEGYWYPGFHVSLIIQVVLGTLLLPSRAILPFWAFQIVTVGIWGHWLDLNYYDPPLLSSGKPVAVFVTTIITLGVQEMIILFIVRYLRLEMENSLRLQQETILNLQVEIDERHRLQVEREEHIAELNRKNAELERFTYTVSHDLKSPLVTIKGFVGMLEKDLRENRPDRVQSDLRRIEIGADKMDALLSDLLELSRIGRIVNPPDEIDTVQLIRDAIESVDAQLRSKNIVVNILPDLPSMYGDHIRLREVFENLISNAAKYMGEQQSPRIEVGVKGQKGESVFYVSDNGMGIEKRYHTRIFNLFEKLNPTIEGTGIGLTLVKRIVEVHGGTIWVESDGLGKGSMFCFTISDERKNSI